MADIREIDALDRALDELLADPSAAPSSPLLDLARELRSALPLEVSAAARDAHLEMIVGVPAGTTRSASLRTRVAVVGLAAAIAVSLFGSAAFAASSSALPGDALFGVKRTFERIGLAMHRSHESRTAFAFEIVQRRLSELRAASGDARRAEQARAAYERALAEADRLLGTEPRFNDALLVQVEEELHTHVVVLNELLEKAPEAARPGIQRAIDNTSKAEERAKRGREKQDQNESPRGRGTTRSGRSNRER